MTRKMSKDERLLRYLIKHRIDIWCLLKTIKPYIERYKEIHAPPK